ncbi:MAG: DNA polymerase [Gemmataceae bacterium]
MTAAFAAVGIKIKSTADEVLAGIDHPLAIALRSFKKSGKLITTYGSKWVAKHVMPDGRVYPTWKQLGAATGRMACSEPNLQQVPKDPEYRKCFVAGPGRVLVKADYSQIQLRIAARIAKDGKMLAAYQGKQDLHLLTASAITGKPADDVTKSDRQLAKAVNFGLLFGMGAEGLVDYARKNFGVSMTISEAQRHRSKFFSTYPGLRRWHDLAGNRPSPETRTLGGRRRMNVEQYTEKLNSPVQGTEADGLKAAIALLWERRCECPSAVPVIFTHDELVIECDEAEADKAANWLQKAMIDGMSPLTDPVPVEVEVKIGRTWAGE